MKTNKNMRKTKYSKKYKKGGDNSLNDSSLPLKFEEPLLTQNDLSIPNNEVKIKPSLNISTCDPNNIVNLKTQKDMHANHQTCCPKKYFMKNSSPYCKQLDLNFQGEETKKKLKKENQENYYSMNDDPPLPVKKSWYKFWGGKNRTLNRRLNKTRRKHQTHRKHQTRKTKRK